MEIYDTDEEQVAALKRWWKENGTATLTGVVIGVMLIAGWKFWQNYTKDKANQASVLYGQLLDDVGKGKDDATQKISARISEDFDSTVYAAYSDFLLAKTKVKQGDLDAAQVLFKKLMSEADSPELRNLARIRLIRVLYSTGENEKGLQLIAEADQSSAQGFISSYDELKGDLYVALDRLGEARTAYQSALRSGSGSRLLQFKLDDISVSEVLESNTKAEG
ncbi:MAG: tetratricopeptide repeat protein [Methylococcaceae bacterium]